MSDLPLSRMSFLGAPLSGVFRPIRELWLFCFDPRIGVSLEGLLMVGGCASLYLLLCFACLSLRLAKVLVQAFLNGVKLLNGFDLVFQASDRLGFARFIIRANHAAPGSGLRCFPQSRREFKPGSSELRSPPRSMTSTNTEISERYRYS